MAGTVPAWDTLHTIDDWYDGPRAGIAEYQGKPYWYRSIYLDGASWAPNEDRFELTPISDDILAMDLELKSIFGRWDSARNSGAIAWEEGNDDSFGALPDEMPRYRELTRNLKTYLASARPTLLVHGKFESGRVQWLPISVIDE